MLRKSQNDQNATFLWEKDGLQRRSPWKYSKTLNLADLIYKVPQNRLLIWNSQNLQKLGFLWKKNRVSLIENRNFLQSAYVWAILSRKRVKWCIWFKILKTFEFWNFLESLISFSNKNLDFFKTPIHALSLLKCVSNGVCIWDFGNRSTFGFFRELIVFFEQTGLLQKG